jgi:hypothetical protein
MGAEGPFLSPSLIIMTFGGAFDLSNLKQPTLPSNGNREKPLPPAQGRIEEGWAGQQVALTILRVNTPLPSILLSWSHWTTVQGVWRELAAHWARDQSCRAALVLW